MKLRSYSVAAVMGASFLSFFSIFQKLLINADPFIPKGFIVPVFFGGFAGLFVAIWRHKALTHQWQLEDLNKELEKRVEDRTHDLSVANRELELANNTKRNFFAIMSHDLRGPIGSFIQLTELLSDNTDCVSDPETKTILSKIDKSGQALLTLIENLFLWAQSQSGKLNAKQSNSDLCAITDNVLQTLTNAAEQKGITLATELHKGTTAYIDSNMISTVIRNLVSNAIKFTRKDGVITVKNIDRGQMIDILVCDSGMGIEEKIAENLFRLDVMHSTKGTDQELGSGMGLNLCKEFVEKNNGKLWLQKTGSNGSTFTFSIPKNELTVE
ncbi:MAG: HAMP domain-containing histidine kinase [Proteobacteria bacterium]|nr:HAMP domain-containing histidine kinase [Pseudomonadota bacterium]